MNTLNLTVQSVSGAATPIDLSIGQTLFVLGANGTGKSSLLQRFAQAAHGRSKRISASRQTWLQSSALEFAPSQKAQLEQQARSWDANQQSRWMEQNAQVRSGLTLYDLIDAENVDARAIAAAMRADEFEKAQRLADEMAPIAKINELLASSNLPIHISVEGGDRLVASKNGSPPYGAAELSDGERNALLIAADVLTAKDDTLLIIDEPERHLHRSIISPLLSQLFRFRSNCAFVVATHDLMLPLDNPDARVLLVRSCIYSGSAALSWDTDLLPANADLDDSLKEDIVGARRKIIFVEGDESSLDKPLYAILFPEVSVRSKGSSRDVEKAVEGVRSSEAVHWVKAWGIVDNDGREPAQIVALRTQGILALPFYSVESVYYHPDLIRLVALRSAALTGEDGEARAREAIAAAIHVTKLHFPRLAARAVEKAIRHRFFEHMPTMSDIEQKRRISVEIDTASVVDAEVATLATAATAGNWTYVLSRCPIRETQALDTIARSIGIPNRHQYESAVLQLLRDDHLALNLARSFFGGLCVELGVA